jgi:carboxyl-terminal processing protease
VARPLVRRRLGYVAAFAAGVATPLLLGAADPYAGLDLFARVLSDVDQSYERPVDLLTLVQAALRGLPAVLDEHSQYFTPEEWAAIRKNDAGLTLGVGAALAPAACGLQVQSVEPWGPAEGQGILAGDCIVAVDGAPLPTPAAPTLLDGLAGTAVRLRVRHEAAEREVALLRGPPHEPAVRVEALAHGVVYARVANFGDPVAAPFARAFQPLQAKALVLDLRQNPGGRVEEAAALVDQFVSAGTIVTTRTRVGGESVAVATAARTDSAVPIAVLVDGETASAAEIVAGALQDLHRATLVGVPTYGKGSVQRVFQYDDGSALKLTVGRYALPSGRTIPDHQGLTPDIVVPSASAAPPDFRTPAAARLGTDGPLAAAVAQVTPGKK